MAELEESGSTASIECTQNNSDPRLISIRGEVDMSNVVTVETDLSGALAGHPAQVVFDLSGLSFIDSSGIAVLLRAAEKTDSIRLRNPSSVVQRILEATGLTDVLPIEP
ncbi:MAG TPA: STAS domain-containing protein [Acidimicrobiia bacterium]|jgi:anti-anti-sigma factor|nr:STAS domain-containing protein [Acidimicrobiia bacterium]